jgi:pimeloyl-ACP methyl ester carboxylesterase
METLIAVVVLSVIASTRRRGPQRPVTVVRSSTLPSCPANVKVEGAGTPIVLIHGFGAAIDWWDDVAPALATDHRVIRIDLIGHGGRAAPGSGYSIERQGTLVSAILDKLVVDRITVIGHSMGGVVATALAELKPERIEP